MKRVIWRVIKFLLAVILVLVIRYQMAEIAFLRYAIAHNVQVENDNNDYYDQVIKDLQKQIDNLKRK